LLPLPAAKDAGAARLPGLLAKHPSTLRMVIEALQAQDKKEGVSVTAIKQFILAKYPTVDPIRLKYLLKQALNKGLSSGVLMRPRKSTAVGATGSFKVSRGLSPTALGLGAEVLPVPASSPLLPLVSSQEAAAQEAAAGTGGY
ncbi:H1FOO protein, partial [Ceuthmochares aereus]|nr:H1FOO protein [Ceuthmochares aereus]